MSTDNAPQAGETIGCRKVLVVDLGFLGDTIHLIPALWEVRRHHPEAILHVVTTPVGAEVLKLVRCVDRVWVYPLGNPSPPWWRHLDLQWGLARERFDRAINFSGADRTLFVTAFAGVGRRTTRAGKRGGWWRRWLGGEVVPAPSRTQAVFEQRRHVLKEAGYDLGPVRFDLEIPREDVDWAGEALAGLGFAGRRVVHVSVNASSPFKEWPIERWIEWSRALLSGHDVCLVATGSPAERERRRLEALAAGVTDGRFRVLGERLSIPRLAALLARCDFHAGTDSGVTHLAMALGLPTVSVFREYEGLAEWRPPGAGHEAVTMPCGCVDRPQMLPECVAAGTAMCLARIGVGDVLACAERVMARRGGE